jgi:hypothetical protein
MFFLPASLDAAAADWAYLYHKRIPFHCEADHIVRGHGIALTQLVRQRAINERTAEAISINLPRNCAVFARLIKFRSFFGTASRLFVQGGPSFLPWYPDR